MYPLSINSCVVKWRLFQTKLFFVRTRHSNVEKWNLTHNDSPRRPAKADEYQYPLANMQACLLRKIVTSCSQHDSDNGLHHGSESNKKDRSNLNQYLSGFKEKSIWHIPFANNFVSPIVYLLIFRLPRFFFFL